MEASSSAKNKGSKKRQRSDIKRVLDIETAVIISPQNNAACFDYTGEFESLQLAKPPIHGQSQKFKVKSVLVK
jgi:hypothetical protein